MIRPDTESPTIMTSNAGANLVRFIAGAPNAIFVGRKIKTVIRSVAYELMRNDSFESCNTDLWYDHQSFNGEMYSEVLFDPIDMLVSGFRTVMSEETVLSFLGLKNIDYSRAESAEGRAEVIEAAYMKLGS